MYSDTEERDLSQKYTDSHPAVEPKSIEWFYMMGELIDEIQFAHVIDSPDDLVFYFTHYEYFFENFGKAHLFRLREGYTTPSGRTTEYTHITIPFSDLFCEDDRYGTETVNSYKKKK